MPGNRSDGDVNSRSFGVFNEHNCSEFLRPSRWGRRDHLSESGHCVANVVLGGVTAQRVGVALQGQAAAGEPTLDNCALRLNRCGWLGRSTFDCRVMERAGEQMRPE